VHLRPQVFSDAAGLGDAAARLVADAIAAAGARPFLLGCPGGRSAASTYQALADLASRTDLDLSRLVVVMMDDYLVQDGAGRLVREDPRAPHSCERFGRRDILGRINASAPAGRRIPADNLWLPDPAAPEAYDDRLADAGGVDLFLLASGASDGHIAFNPAGSARDSRTRVVRLPDSTRTDNLATFPSFGGDLSNVPRFGVTVGIETISSLSRSVLMLCHGSDKGRAVSRLAAATGYEPGWPATVVTECRSPALLVDRAAEDAAGLLHVPG
jgi:glucosamine-6-phosphate deaminase